MEQYDTMLVLSYEKYNHLAITLLDSKVLTKEIGSSPIAKIFIRVRKKIYAFVRNKDRGKTMKRIVSISLGSSVRDHVVEFDLLDMPCRVERIGTNGNIQKMIDLITELDGQVDAFGLGGINLNFHVGTKRFTMRQAKQIVRAAKKTPIVDGSGLKGKLEGSVVQYLQRETDLLAGAPNVLMMYGVDRFGMSQALEAANCNITFGDLAFTIGLPIPIHSLRSLNRLAYILLPLLCRLPFSLIYPTGKKQEENKPKVSYLFDEATIIAGDYHFISRYMPGKMLGKVILTNTTTAKDVELLRQRGVKTLITTTPSLNGRSFGVNVMEALLVALSGQGRELTEAEYDELLVKTNFIPQILELNEVD